MPLENSQAGSVNETYDLLLHTTLLRIVGEVVVRVDHALLGVPGARLEEIARARSHWQALAQCEEFLASMRIEPVPVHDTAGAARQIAAAGARDEAAIASVDAATNFGLAVLAERIQTEKENFTKFAVLGTEDAGHRAGGQDLARDGPCWTSPGRCSGRSSHSPSAGSTCTSSSRARGAGKPFEYLMYVDVMAGGGRRPPRGGAR